jgi:hypothetical protein
LRTPVRPPRRRDEAKGCPNGGNQGGPLGKRPSGLPRSDHHQQNFLDAVRTRRPVIAPPEIAHRSTTICHLAVICLRLGRKLRWDPVKEQCVGDDDANRMLARARREPWTL